MLGAAVAGALAFVASQASAFPLKLTSCSGTLTVTPSYAAIASANSAKPAKASFDLKKVMTIVTNQVFLNSTNLPPNGSYVVNDPYLAQTYLTNSNGYYYDLSTNNVLNLTAIVSFGVSDIATSFKGNANGGTENDVCIGKFSVAGYGPDGLFYAVQTSGQTTINASYKSRTSTAKVTISGTGSGYGEFKSSTDGVANGKLTMTGSGTPEWGNRAFSVYYEGF